MGAAGLEAIARALSIAFRPEWVDRSTWIASGAVVTEGQIVAPRSLVLGVPERVVRRFDDVQAAKVREQAARYVAYAELYRGRMG